MEGAKWPRALVLYDFGDGNRDADDLGPGSREMGNTGYRARARFEETGEEMKKNVQMLKVILKCVLYGGVNGAQIRHLRAHIALLGNALFRSAP